MSWLRVLRAVAVLQAVAICVQPIAIGVYLNGSVAGLKIHEPVGLALAFLGLGQLIVAIVYWRRGGRLLAPVTALLILSLEAVQIAMGYSRQSAVHIPLGVVLVGTAVCFAGWICRRTVVAA